MKNSRINFSQMMKLSSEFNAIVKWWDDYSKSRGFTNNRQRGNIIMKHAFFVAVRELTTLSLTEIGNILDKDHATVLHAKKNHLGNLKYLPTYEDVYNDIYYGLRKALAIKGIHREVETIDDVKELRHRLIQTSERLRMKIVEINMIHKQLEDNPDRLTKENEFLKKHNRDINERNKRLEKELARVKNLI